MVLDAQAVAEQVSGAPKYRHLCPQTVRRVAEWSAARARTPAEAVKRAKRKLHQVYAAYLEPWDPRKAQTILDRLPPRPAPEVLRRASRDILALHASTRERLDGLESFYGRVFSATGRPRRVLDIGCGLHPVALPWMDLPDEAEYLATEIDARMVALVNRFLVLAGRGPGARCQDVLVEVPDWPADVTFLLKMLPCLEQQEEGCSRRVLEALPGRFLVVSFPVRSLGGRGKGMPAHYATAMDCLLAGTSWRAGRIDRPGELVYVVDRHKGQ